MAFGNHDMTQTQNPDRGAKEYITKDIAIINSEIAPPILQNHLFHLQLHLHLKVLVPQ